MSVNLCPICETDNKAEATHCEVCGERLVPAAEGEVLSPEESVSAYLAAQAVSEVKTEPMAAEGAGPEVDFARVPPVESSIPSVLYSPLSGEAFYPGSSEFEDGFGPLGEELQAEPPAALPKLAEPVAESGGPSGFDNEFDEPVHPSRAHVEHKPVEPVVQVEPVAVAPASATLTLYVNRQPVHTYSLETDETLLGRRDPRADSFPEFDLTPWDADAAISRKHAYIYRQNRTYSLYVVSNAGTQVNQDLLGLGDRKQLTDGDVVILAGRFALKFEIPG